ncbi:hypothetical protein HYV82_05025 [Candidatus Woesearchaeota archaeon]|nr:hypothetical protein [Candidatus Woesearchaeota archaeon]
MAGNATRLIPAAAALALLPAAVHAHCPLCTAAVGTAAVTAKYFGLNASIIGVFIGAFGVSTGLWLALKLKKKIALQTPLIVLASFLLTTLPLLVVVPDTFYFPLLVAGDAGTVLNRVYWVNKLLFGSVLGLAATTIAFSLHKRIKEIRGKVLFPFQGVALTVAALLILSSALYFMVK